MHHPFWQYFHQPGQYNSYVRQQISEVDSALFHKSAKTYKALLKDATIIVNKLAESEEFAFKIMQAAQQNNTEQVENLIKSTGINETIEIGYNPDGINLKMASKVENIECCKLEMAIRWG